MSLDAMYDASHPATTTTTASSYPATVTINTSTLQGIADAMGTTVDAIVAGDTTPTSTSTVTPVVAPTVTPDGNPVVSANPPLTDISFTILADRSWISPSDTEQQILDKLAQKLQAAGYKPFTAAYEGLFISTAQMIANSTYTSGVGDPYANPTTGNQGLTNWMGANLTYEMAKKLGIDVTSLRSLSGNLSPDAMGSYSNLTHEFIPVNDPWARDQNNEKILDENGKPMLVPVYSFIKIYTQLNGRAPSQAEIDAGTRDVIANEGWYATGRTGGTLAAGTAGGIGGTSGTTSALGTFTYDPITGTYKPSTTNTAGAKTLSGVDYNNRMSVYATMADRFNQYGLTGLADKIKQLAMEGASEATITLQLQDTEEYKQRFAANAERIKAGLAVLPPGQYLALEDGYRQVLRAYGLTAFDNDAYVQQFIANDMSPTELSNRVVTAVQRVQNADPAIAKQLRDYYGIGTADMVAYVLDPQQQFQKIERQVSAAEIGVAGAVQGLNVGVGVAEQLAAQGVTQAQAQKGYSTIADILPTAEKLTAIYGGSTGATYNQSTAEQEVFNSLASAQRARQKLTATEVATFSGSTGNAASALTTSTKGSI